jgi:hypothetical protein
LLDPYLFYNKGAFRVYLTSMSFDAHPLSRSTILDNGAATYLVNSVDLLKLGSFRRSKFLQTVEAGTQAFLILGTGSQRFPKLLHRAQGELTEDLVL